MPNHTHILTPLSLACFWQNNFFETMADSRGPEGKASMTVEGKMFGLTFHEQWYASSRLPLTLP